MSSRSSFLLLLLLGLDGFVDELLEHRDREGVYGLVQSALRVLLLRIGDTRNHDVLCVVKDMQVVFVYLEEGLEVLFQFPSVFLGEYWGDVGEDVGALLQSLSEGKSALLRCQLLSQCFPNDIETGVKA